MPCPQSRTGPSRCQQDGTSVSPCGMRGHTPDSPGVDPPVAGRGPVPQPLQRRGVIRAVSPGQRHQGQCHHGPMPRPATTRPERVTFRLPVPALLFPVLLLFCIMPLATAGGAWGVLYVVPVAALAWVIITRTTATPTEVTAYGLLGTKRMAWTDMAGLELKDARWATAVGLDGRRLRLPMVRPRDLPRLAAVSGGSLNLGGPVEDSALGRGQCTEPGRRDLSRTGRCRRAGKCASSRKVPSSRKRWTVHLPRSDPTCLRVPTTHSRPQPAESGDPAARTAS